MLETPMGTIVLELDVDRAPATAGNFLGHLDRGLYRGAAFYRALRPEDDANPVKASAIQGGIYRRAGVQNLGAIAHEGTKTTGLSHRAGAISMARDAVGSADSEFFIVAEDSPELDEGGRRHPDGHGFAAFGHVIAGMSVVRAIQRGEHFTGSAELTATLARDVPITAARRIL
jgi:peptidyl-prolyl cis-trans isomerase A (cyclophilin A)